MSRSSRATVVLPFDAYHLDDAALATIADARSALVRECMADKGFDWKESYGFEEGNPLLAGNARRYGLADSEAAERYGYHVPDSPQERQAQAAEAAWRELASKEEKAALYDPDGCADRTDSALWKGIGDRNTSWFTDLEFEAVDLSAEDPAVASAIQAWSDCMHDKGFDYRTPQAAVEDRRWKLDSPRVSPAERAVAVADVGCKKRTDLIAARTAAEQLIQAKMLEQHAKRFEALRKMNAHLVGNARHVLDSDDTNDGVLTVPRSAGTARDAAVPG
ncbi:hypothetical protein ABGB18_40155 [Nonomuraea sp. B12E4]|uniref:hypothetical protein n=1 Tax=Nonomuraea sp. B12E4 TaxID=3153564 RepID=UPI00325CC008